MTTICETRDQVVDLLNQQITQQGITPILTAVAAYEDSSDLQSLAGGRLLVIARELASEMVTFDSINERRPKLDVIVQYKGKTVTPAELDPYLQLSETLCDVVLGQTLPNGLMCIEADWPMTRTDGAFVLSHLEKFQVLTCLTMLTFSAVD